VIALFFVLACASTPEIPTAEAPSPSISEPSEAPAAPALPVIGTLNVEPHFELRFLGEEVPDGINPDRGIRGLEFTLEDGSVHVFQPTGTLYHSDWSSELRSPDGRWLYLPQDHYGPFHIVSVERVGAYLQGAAPDRVVGHQSAEGESAWVHAGARWTGGSTFSFRAGLTTMEQFDVVLD